MRGHVDLPRSGKAAPSMSSSRGSLRALLLAAAAAAAAAAGAVSNKLGYWFSCRRFGLDCPEQLEWRHWNPGTEYVKQLVLKNVSTSVLKIRFKQPTSKAFGMDFPEPFKLRPGMSQPLKVVFRPLKQQHYSDNVELFVGNVSCLVPVHAYTPVTHIEVRRSGGGAVKGARCLRWWHGLFTMAAG